MIYHLYTWFHGTQGFKALVGLAALGVIYLFARFWGLFLTTWSFQILWQVLLILLIVLFQSEIRQALGRVNPLRILGLHAISASTGWIPPFAEAVFAMTAPAQLPLIGKMIRIDPTLAKCTDAWKNSSNIWPP